MSPSRSKRPKENHMAGKVSSITKPPAVSDVHILWITAGLSCDGDSVSVTAAEQASIEDVLLVAIPGLAKGHLHNLLLAYENSEEEGYWAAWGTNTDTGQPITTCEWIDRLAPQATAVIGAGTCATYGGIHAMEGNTPGCVGSADYLGRGLQAE